VDTAELQQLVAEIGEEILARLGQAPGGCSTCAQTCPQTCAVKTQEIIQAGAERVSSCERVAHADPAIARLIDHTLLKPDATRDQVITLCREARRYGFASVCVNPYWVPVAAAELAGSSVKVCTVVGFPLGANTTRVKMAETEEAVRAGAQEIDMVINVGALRSGDYDTVKTDIQGVVGIAHRGGALVKTLLETALLDDNQKAIACTLAKLAGADFVKTSTGFGPAGATVHDVALMRLTVGDDMGVKAAGGIRTYADAQKMIEAGATRIGASASVKIMQEAGAG
jgi:deoxyribose-phosphate aldolase